MRPESLSLAAATGRFGGEPRCPVRPKSGTPRLSVGTAGVKGGPGTPPIAQAAAQLQVHMSTGGGSDRDRNPTAGKRRPFWQWPSSGLGSCLACAFSCSLQTLPFSRGRRELERTPEPAPPALNRRSCIQAREAPGRRESRPIIRGPARHTPEPVPPTLNRRSCIQACEALHFPLAVTMFPSRCVYRRSAARCPRQWAIERSTVGMCSLDPAAWYDDAVVSTCGESVPRASRFRPTALVPTCRDSQLELLLHYQPDPECHVTQDQPEMWKDG